MISPYSHIGPEQAKVFLRLWAEGFYKGMSYKQAWELFSGVDCELSSWQDVEALVRGLITQ